MDLFLRAGRGDNRIVDELLAPAAAGIPFGRRVPIRGLVVDAPTAVRKPAFGEAAEAAGLPFLIDPLTVLLQDTQAPDQAWAALDFGQPEAVDTKDFTDGKVLDELIERVITFQLEHQARVLIPPYFNAKSPSDPWWRIQLAVNRRTGAFLRAEGIHLPVAPILAGALRRFGTQRSWPGGVDEFLDSITGMTVRNVALALSFTRPRTGRGDTVDNLGGYLSTVQRIAAAEPVIAWRQGQYGLAAAAAGAAGYQTGFGTDERCDMTTFMRNRRPKEGPPAEVRLQKRIYLRDFNRSTSAKVANTLLSTGHLRGVLTCRDTTCCPDGASSMMSTWRQHAARSRASELEEMRQMPDSTWRLNDVARKAERAAIDARTANQVLRDAGLPDRLPAESFRSLAEVADAMRDSSARRAAG